jgi:hypothetical protein
VEADDTCGDGEVDISGYFVNNWTTANHAVATVSGAGLHTGVGVGSTTSTTNGVYAAYAPRSCPVIRQYANGGDNVTPTVTISYNPGYLYIGQGDPTVAQANLMGGTGSPSGGTLKWSSTKGGISFDNSQAAIVHVTATTYTGGTNDTPITLNYTYNGASAQPSTVNVTQRIFKFLAGDSVIRLTSYNGPSTYGYIYQATYNVYTNPGGQKVTTGSGIGTTETVTLVSSNVSFNPNYGQAALNANSQVVDNPIGLTSNAPLPTGLSIVDSQDIGVGGIYVRTNTLTYTAGGVTVVSDGPFN